MAKNPFAKYAEKSANSQSAGPEKNPFARYASANRGAAPAQPEPADRPKPWDVARETIGLMAPGAGAVADFGAKMASGEIDAGRFTERLGETIPARLKRQAAGLRRFVGEKLDPADVWERMGVPEETAEQATNVLAQLSPSVKMREQLSEAMVSGAAEDFEQQTKIINRQNADVEPGSTEYYANAIIGSSVEMAPAAIASILTRNPNVGAAMMGSQVFGDVYGESRSSGRSESEATMDALSMAAVETLTERIPLGVLSKQGKSAIARIWKAGAAEGVQEPLTEAFQMAYDAGVLDDKSLYDEQGNIVWGRVFTRLKDAAIIGIGAGGTLALTTTNPKQVKEQWERARARKRMKGAEKKAAEVGISDEEVADRIEAYLREQGKMPPGLPRPDTTIYADSRGGAGTVEQRQRQQAEEEAGRRDRVSVGLTPDIEREVARRAGQEAERYKKESGQTALPPPDPTISVDSRGEASTAAQRDAARRQTEERKAELVEMGLTPDVLRAQQQREERAADRYIALEAPRQTDDRVQPVPDPVVEWADPRLKRPQYRAALAQAATEVVEGGGAAGQLVGGDFSPINKDRPRDKETPVQRLPSENPPWAQRVLSDTGMSVPQLKIALAKGLQGEKLGIRQQKAVQATLDEMTQERTAGVIGERLEQLEAARQARRQARARREVTPKELEALDEGTAPYMEALADIFAGEVYDEQAYAPELDAEARGFYELIEQAAAVDEGRAESIILRAEKGGLTESEAAQLLWGVIQEGNNGQQQLQASDQGVLSTQGRRAAGAETQDQDEKGGAAARPRPDREVDLLGEDTRARQALADEGRRRDADRNTGQDSVETGRADDLFSEARRQTDLVDQATTGQDERRRNRAQREAAEELPEKDKDSVIAQLRSKNADLRQKAYFHHLTGLPNLLSFKEDATLNWPVVVAADFDGLSWINDNWGHETADDILRQTGQEMQRILDNLPDSLRGEVRLYHRSGDEFALRAKTEEAARTVADEMQNRLEQTTIKVEKEGLTPRTLRGAGISYGIGANYDQADNEANRQKQEREASGRRAPKLSQPPGAVEQPAERVPGREGDAPVPEGEAVQRPPVTPAEAPPETPAQAGVSRSGGQVARAEAETDTKASEAQRRAGNYRKGKVRLHGMEISIETPAGERRNPDWPPLAHAYGYFRGTDGKDGDQLDVFLGPDAENPNRPVFVIDQLNPATGRFDEHKVMLGFADVDSAQEGYLANYEEGWDRNVGSVIQFERIADFRRWMDEASQRRPAAETAERFDGKLPFANDASVERDEQEAREDTLPNAPAKAGEYWRVGGLDGRIGLGVGYNQANRYVIEFQDGTREAVSPHQVFRATAEDYAAQQNEARPGAREGSGLYSENERETDNLQDRERDAGISEPAADAERAAQGDLFDPENLPQKTAKEQARDTFYVRYEQVPTGTIPAGIDTARSPEQAAHILAPIRKYGQETFVVLVTDKNHKVISLIRHTIGTRDGASVFPGVVAGAIAGTEGAANIWYGHNHPSGVSTPSGADYTITRKLNAMLDGLDVDVRGHIVVAPGSDPWYFPKGGTDRGESITPVKAPRRRKVNITERMIRQRSSLPFAAINSPEHVKSILERLDTKNGILLLNNRHHPVGVIAMSPEEMKTLREGGRVRRILSSIDKTNASAVIPFTTDEMAAENVSKFLNRFGDDLRVLDAFVDGRSSSSVGTDIHKRTGPFYSVDEGLPESPVQRANELEEMAPMPVESGPLRDMTGVELRNAAREVYRELRQQGPVEMRDGRQARLTPVGFKKTRHHSADPKTLRVIPQLRDFLSRAVPLWSDPHRGGSQDSVIAYHNYGLKVRFEDGDYYLRLVVREDANGNIYYDNDLSRAEKIGEGVEATPETKPGAAPVTDTKRLDQWLLAVKSGAEPPDFLLDAREAKGAGVDVVGLQTHVDSILSTWKRAPFAVRVAARPADLPAEVAAQAPKGRVDRIKGVFDPETNTIWLVASNLKSFQEAERALFHEALGHFGMRATLGPHVTPFLRRVAKTYGRRGLRDIAEKYGYDLTTDDGLLAAAEEKVAQLAEEVNQGTATARAKRLWDEFVELVRRALRKLGMGTLALNEAELRNTVREFGRRVREGRSDQQVAGMTMFRFSMDGGPPSVMEKPSLFEDGFDTPADTLMDYVRYRLQDRYIDLRRVQEAVQAQGGQFNEAMDAYLAEELYHGRAEERIERSREEQTIEPLLKAIKDAGLTVEQAEEYLYARHAPERNAQIDKINPDLEGAGSGMSNDEAKSIMARYAGNAKVQRIGEIVDAITAANRKILVEEGLEPEEAVQAWQETYQYYIPLKGRADESGTIRSLLKRGRGFDVRGRTKRAFGRRSRATNIISNLIAEYETNVIRAEKARVGRALLQLAQANPNPDLWEVDQVEYEPRINQKTGLVEYRPSQRYKLADNVLSVKVDGREHHITFKGERGLRLAASIKNMGAADTGAVIRGLAGLNRFLSALNTAWNPEFVISNFARDIQTAGINLAGTEAADTVGAIMQDVWKAWKGIRAVQKDNEGGEWGRNFRDFRRAGGKTGWIDAYNDVERLQSSLLKEIARQERKGGDPRNLFNALKEFIEAENTAVENAIRLSSFVHARRLGLSDAKAASLAKNLTVNFNRRGSWGVTANALYLFYNASIQGSVRLLQAMKSPRVRKIAAGVVVSSAVLDVLNRMLGGEDDETGKSYYDMIPGYVKERYLVIMIPGTEGSYIALPMPYGYNVLAAMGRFMGGGLSSGMGLTDDFDSAEGALEVVSAVIGSFNPVGSDSTLTQFISPTFFDPIVQVAENKDFAGRKVHPEQNPFAVAPKPESQLFWSTTTEPSKLISKTLNDLTGGSQVRPGLIDVSPATLDHIYEFVTGGAGRFLSMMVDAPAKWLSGEDIEARRIPFVRKLYGEVADREVFNDFYANLQQIEYANKEVELARKNRDREAYRDAVDTYQPYLRARVMARNANNRINDLRERRDEIEASDMPLAEKRERLESIDEEISRIMRLVNGKIREEVNEADK